MLVLAAVVFILVTQTLSSGMLIKDKVLKHHVLTTTSQSSLYDCSAACVVDKCCKSFNFFISTLECQLNFRTKEERSQDFVTKKGSIYQDKDSIDKSVAGVCDSNMCRSFEQCVNSPSGPRCAPRAGVADSSPSNYQQALNSTSTRNCYDVMISNDCSDVYTLTAPEVSNLTVFCDMTTLSGGWMVIQRRMDGSTDFYRTWQEYKEGFGDVEREFWLGNENIYKITSKQEYELRVDLEDFEGNKSYAMYSTFSLGSEAENYTLDIGSYSGNAGDSLTGHKGQSFTTKDSDRDVYTGNCARVFHGAWWYSNCHSSNLNGKYLRGRTAEYATGACWSAWMGYYYSLKRTEMKIRPI